MFCGDPALVKQERHRRALLPLACRCWSCEDCQPKRRWGVIKLGEEGKAERLITLTIRPTPGRTPDQDAQFMAASYAKLIRWLRRRHGGRRVQMMRVFEAHKSGRPHMHVLHRGAFVPIFELIDQWEALTGSRGVDIRSIKKKRNVAKYVSKYIGKDIHSYTGVKRYYYTRGWVKTRAEKKADREAAGISFRLEKLSPEEIAAKWAGEGWITQWIGGALYGLWPFMEAPP